MRRARYMRLIPWTLRSGSEHHQQKLTGIESGISKGVTFALNHSLNSKKLVSALSTEKCDFPFPWGTWCKNWSQDNHLYLAQPLRIFFPRFPL